MATIVLFTEFKPAGYSFVPQVYVRVKEVVVCTPLLVFSTCLQPASIGGAPGSSSTTSRLQPALRAGGGSAHGQPVDQLHSQYRSKIRRLDLAELQHHNLFERPMFEELPLRSSGIQMNCIGEMLNIYTANIDLGPGHWFPGWSI